MVLLFLTSCSSPREDYDYIENKPKDETFKQEYEFDFMSTPQEKVEARDARKKNNHKERKAKMAAKKKGSKKVKPAKKY